MERQQDFSLLRLHSNQHISAIIVEVDNLPDDLPGAGVTNLHPDDRIFIVLIRFGTGNLAADKFLGFLQGIDILEFDDETAAPGLDRFNEKGTGSPSKVMNTGS